MSINAQQAAIAAHRFGLGEATLNRLGDDAAGWLLAQVGPAEAQRGTGLATGVEGLKRYAEFLARQRALPYLNFLAPACLLSTHGMPLNRRQRDCRLLVHSWCLGCCG